jgi:hypothetical protein
MQSMMVSFRKISSDSVTRSWGCRLRLRLRGERALLDAPWWEEGRENYGLRIIVASTLS